jgi:hypothetical protein
MWVIITRLSLYEYLLLEATVQQYWTSINDYLRQYWYHNLINTGKTDPQLQLTIDSSTLCTSTCFLNTHQTAGGSRCTSQWPGAGFTWSANIHTTITAQKRPSSLHEGRQHPVSLKAQVYLLFGSQWIQNIVSMPRCLNTPRVPIGWKPVV